MDHFGIGAAMKAAAMIYGQAAKQTGRTTSLVESLKDGDRVVFVSQGDAIRFRNICLSRGLKVECVVISVEDPHELMQRNQSEGRTLFDHAWVELFYLRRIELAAEAIDRMQQESSNHRPQRIDLRRKRFKDMDCL